MDVLATAINTLAAQVAANYHALMDIQHMDALLFVLAGGTLVTVVPYVTKKYSGTIDAPPPSAPVDKSIFAREQKARGYISVDTGLSVPLASAPNVPVPSIWGHPNTIHHTPSEPWNQAVTLRSRLPPTQATPWASLGLVVIGILFVSFLARLVRRCFQARRSSAAATATANEEIPTDGPVNTSSDNVSAIPAAAAVSAAANSENDNSRAELLEKELETTTQSLAAYIQALKTQQDEYNSLYAQFERFNSHFEVENSALSDAKQREDELIDNIRIAENEIEALKAQIKEFERPEDTRQQLVHAKVELEAVRARLRDEQAKLDDCKTKRKHHVGDAQYAKALEKQLADLRLQLEDLTVARTTVSTSESAADGALKYERQDLEYELELRDRTISDLEKQVNKLQDQAKAFEGQAAYDDFRSRSELTDQVESQAQMIQKLKEQVKESEGRFLVVEGEMSNEDLRRRAVEDLRTIGTLKTENKRLKVQLLHANVEQESRVSSVPVTPVILTPGLHEFPASTVQAPNSAVDTWTYPQQGLPRAALGRPATVSSTLQDNESTVVDAILTRSPARTTPKTQSLLGGSKYASWKCSHCRCTFSGGKINQKVHEDVCRNWHEHHVHKGDMTLDIEHPPNWKDADPLDADATNSEWMSLITDKQKQQQIGLGVTEDESSQVSVASRGPQTPLKAEAINFTPRNTTLPSGPKNPDSTKAAEQVYIDTETEILTDELADAHVIGSSSGETLRAAAVESDDAALEYDETEDTASETTDSSRDFYLGDQSAAADAMNKAIRSASGGEGDVVGYINNGVIPVYATEVAKYVDNPDYDFKWVLGKGSERETESEEEVVEAQAQETGNEINEQAEKEEETGLGAGDQIREQAEVSSEETSALVGSKSPSPSEPIPLNGGPDTGAPQKTVTPSSIQDNSSTPERDPATQSKTKTGNTSDPLILDSEPGSAAATAAEIHGRQSFQQDPSNTFATTADGKAASQGASTSDQSTITSAPSSRDLNTSKLPLRTSPEHPVPERQGMRGNRPTGPKLDLTKISAQRIVSGKLDTPKMVRNNSTVSPSLAGSRFAPGSPRQSVTTPGSGSLLPMNSATPSRRTNISTPHMPRSATGYRQSNAATPDAPLSAPTGPSGKNTCRLCGATFIDSGNPRWSFSQDHLPKCRAWKTEWEPQNYAKKNGDPKFPPQWKNERTQRPAVDPDWLVKARVVQSERDYKMKKAFFVNGTPEAAATITTDQQSDSDNGNKTKDSINDFAIKNIPTEGEDMAQQTASTEATKGVALDSNLEEESTKSQSEQRPETSSSGTDSSNPKKPMGPLKWGDDEEEDSGADLRVPSWSAESQDPEQAQEAPIEKDKKKESGGQSELDSSPGKGKDDIGQAEPSSAHGAHVTSGRNQVLVDVPLSTPPFKSNSGQLSGGGLGGSRWANSTPTEGLHTPSPGARSQDAQTPRSGGGRQNKSKGKGRGGYGAGKKK